MTQPARNLLTEPLADLYKNRYEGKFKRPKHVFAFDMGLIAVGAALAVISIYFGLIYKPFEAVTVGLTAEPNAPSAGGEIVLNLTVTNNGNDPLDDVSAVLKFLAQIKFERSSLPYDRATQTVDFDEIGAKSETSVRIVGALSGAVGQDIRASANVAYKDASGNIARKNAAASVKIAGSSIGAGFEMPDNIVVGQTISGDIRYFNHGNSPADNIVITPDWPQNFVLASSSPAIKNGAWVIGTIAPGSEGKISWSGSIGASGGASANIFAVETGVRSGADILTQSQNKTVVTLIDPEIGVALDGASVARLGDTLALSATYKNTGDHTLNGVAITATADPGFTVLNIDRAALGDIAPEDSGTVKITVRVDDELPDALKNATDVQLAVRASIAGKLDNDRTVAISSPTWIVKIATQLGMTAGARYWSDTGDQLGRGPLPPVVGKTTTLWGFWNVTNTTGAVNNVRITGKLPANVTYTGKAANPFGSAPLYDPATRAMTWNVATFPHGPGWRPTRSAPPPRSRSPPPPMSATPMRCS